MVFRKIVELDMEANRVLPGTVEVTPHELAVRCGLDEKKLEKGVKAMRKAGVVRAFLPEHAEEPALFQVITPIPTPLGADEVRARHPAAFAEGDWPPRYALAPEQLETHIENQNTKIKQVVELYFNLFSMKMNAFILDEIRLIAYRYDLDLIRKVFDRARQKEMRSLAWILAEIRREEKAGLGADSQPPP